MKTKNASPMRQLVLAALFLALAFVLPLLTGQVPKVGNMLCPMHFPVLLCGFVLGGPWGLAVGFAAPLLRSVLFGMPPMFPVAISMAFELAAYGLVSGLLWRRAKHNLPALYAVLLTAMVSGRIVWGIVRFVLAGLTGGSFPFSAFLSGALFTAGSQTQHAVGLHDDLRRNDVCCLAGHIGVVLCTNDLHDKRPLFFIYSLWAVHSGTHPHLVQVYHICQQKATKRHNFSGFPFLLEKVP